MCALDFGRVVVICQNVCPRFWPGSGFWVVAGFRGVGGRWDSGFRISLERKLTNGLFKFILYIKFFFLLFRVRIFSNISTFFTRPLF